MRSKVRGEEKRRVEEGSRICEGRERRRRETSVGRRSEPTQLCQNHSWGGGPGRRGVKKGRRGGKGRGNTFT